MNKLRIGLLSAALLATPFYGIKAYNWMPVGDGVATSSNGLTGYATQSSVYERGDVLTDEGNEAGNNGSYGSDDTESESDNTVDIYGKLNGDGDDCPLKVDGDVTLASGSTGNLTVNTMTDVTIEPYRSTLTPGQIEAENDGAQVVFDTTAGGNIIVNVNHNLIFRGMTDDVTSGDPDNYSDLHISFKGPGLTTFNMADGTVIKFDGQMDESAPATIDPATGLINPGDGAYSANAGGVKVFVTMDQKKSDVEAGINKVLFKRQNNGVDANARTMVYVGTNSVFTYVSDNYAGFASDYNSDGSVAAGVPSDIVEMGGHAAVGFDPYNPTGTGRMVFFIKGAYYTGWQDGIPGDDEVSDDNFLRITKKFPFNDGAMVISGHYVSSFDAADLRTAANSPDESGYSFCAPAGVQAYMRVVDNEAYAAATATVGSLFNPTSADRRGLLVINDCQNLGKYASDPYWDFYNTQGGYVGNAWAYSTLPTLAADGPKTANKNVRTGFVLGVNGVLDIYDTAFLDYAGGAAGDIDYAASIDNDLSYIKRKNPSALIVDGLDTGLFNSNPNLSTSFYDAANPFISENGPIDSTLVTHPQIILRGAGQLLLKNVASSATDSLGNALPSYGYMVNFWAPDQLSPATVEETLANSTIDYNLALACAPLDYHYFEKSTYDGYQLSNNPYTKTGEGEHVLDVEGSLSVANVSNATLNRNYDPTYGTNIATGSITLASLLTDHTGREINLIYERLQAPNIGRVRGANKNTSKNRTGREYTISLINGGNGRPLLLADNTNDFTSQATSYVRYNSPALFINGKISLFNTIYNHTDATKFISGIPNESEPGITGGERLFFAASYNDESLIATDPERFRFPEFRLFNSEFQAHESVCSSGMRFVVMDDPSDVGVAGSNNSVIRFYDHGTALDTDITGRGRFFMLGSELNTMYSPSAPINWATFSAFVSVFKRNQPSFDQASAIIPPSTATLSLRNGNEFPASVALGKYNSERAGNYIWFGLPTNIPGAQTGVFVGWSTVAPDISDPLAFPNSALSFPTADSRVYPYPDEVRGLSATTDLPYLFKLDAIDSILPCPKANLTIEGNTICFDGSDNDGNSSVVPVKDETTSGNVFVGYGGKFTTSVHPVDVRVPDLTVTNNSFINTTLATRVWSDFDYNGTNLLFNFSGEVNLPSDQVEFGDGYSIQPSGFSPVAFDGDLAAAGFLRLPTSDNMTIAWNYRDANILQLLKNAGPINAYGTGTDVPYILYVGAGSDIQQLSIAGATITDPFYMDIAGDGANANEARIREFTSFFPAGAQRIPGSGEHAVIFAEFGGRFGLGNKGINSSSAHAWNKLGRQNVTIAPLGSCTVDVNSDLDIVDELPLMATQMFGSGSSADRITFTSPDERIIRIKAGVVVDLTGFGQGAQRQEIAFAGKVKLILEAGASIRFPDLSKVVGGVVLYFNDDSQLIFEGISDSVSAVYPSAAATDANHSTFYGKGQIWMNKNALLNVMGTACVDVQADATSLNTDVTFSLQRASQFNIGDPNLSGGNFQVGNLVPVSVNGTNASINFSLLINGDNALFHTDRQGFFGLGAGFVNGVSSKPNGRAVQLASGTLAGNPQLGEDGKAEIVNDLPVFNPDGDNVDFTSGQAWQIVPLFNVNNITITNANGIIEHANIGNGSDSNASLWALGQFGGRATINLNGGANAIVRGGGNIMYVPSLVGKTDQNGNPLNFITANVWDYAGPMENGEQYNILGSGLGTLSRTDFVGTVYAQGGQTFVSTTGLDLFNTLATQVYSAQPRKLISVGATQYGVNLAFTNQDVSNITYPVNLVRIVREVAPKLLNGDVSLALDIGVVGAQAQGNADPTAFSLIQ